MNKTETTNFMERIKSHYQEFIIDDFKVKEWYKELQNYDAEDVNRKLDEHLRSEVYGENIPKLYFLTKYLTPSKDKGKVVHKKIICNKCGYSFWDTEYDQHLQRCIEVHTVMRDMKKHYQMKLNYHDLMALSDERFEEVYQRYLDKMLDAPTVSDIQKRIIMHIKYPEYTDDDITEIIKQLSQQN